MEDFNNIKKLIKQAIRVDNRIYQSKRIKKELSRLLQAHKLQVLR